MATNLLTILGHWKIANVQCVLDRLYEGCSDLQSLTIAGWKGLTSEHLTFIVESFKSLNKIDLSSINVSDFDIPATVL